LSGTIFVLLIISAKVNAALFTTSSVFLSYTFWTLLNVGVAMVRIMLCCFFSFDWLVEFGQ